MIYVHVCSCINKQGNKNIKGKQKTINETDWTLADRARYARLTQFIKCVVERTLTPD